MKTYSDLLYVVKFEAPRGIMTCDLANGRLYRPERAPDKFLSGLRYGPEKTKDYRKAKVFPTIEHAIIAILDYEIEGATVASFKPSKRLKGVPSGAIFYDLSKSHFTRIFNEIANNRVQIP